MAETAAVIEEPQFENYNNAISQYLENNLPTQLHCLHCSCIFFKDSSDNRIVPYCSVSKSYTLYYRSTTGMDTKNNNYS